MKEYIVKFDKGEKRRPSRVRKDFENARKRTVRKLKSVEDENERAVLIQRIKTEDKERAMFPSCDEMDTDYKRLKYVRYADDFLIGIIGSKQDAKEVKEDIKNFLCEKLKLELSDEKTLITHTEDSARFLGYEIFVRKSNAQRRDIAGRLRRTYGKRVYLKISTETMRNKLLDYGVLEFRYQNGKEIWKPKCRSGLIFNDDLEILDRYNREIRGFYNYYSIANNCSELHNFRFIMEYSMYKTFAGKYKSSTRKINAKYRTNGKFTVRFTTKSGAVKDRCFYDLGLRRKNPMTDAGYDIMPYSIFDAGRTSLIDRLKAEKCEMCGATEKLFMHHVRKLKNL